MYFLLFSLFFNEKIVYLNSEINPICHQVKSDLISSILLCKGFFLSLYYIG